MLRALTISFVLLFAMFPNISIAQSAANPNIVYIFADDMGWGTGQFNNTSSQIDTPHLNQLAGDGLNFTRHYSATVCSPSRAMLMTGFHTGNTSNDRNGNISQGLQAEEVTVGNVLSDAGYDTSVFGKWGWGGSGGSGALRPNPTINTPATLPQNKGFDTFYGYLNHGRAHSYEVDSLWTTTEPVDDDNDGNDEVGEKYQASQDNGLWLEKTGNNSANTLTNYTHDLIGIKSEQYVRDSVSSGQPFYMQVNYTIPHFDLDSIANTDPLLNLDGEVIYDGGLAQYASNASMSDKEKKHAAMISRMDASIGSLIETLEDPNGDGDSSDSVLDNTLIVFSSDNGPTPEDGLGTAGLNNLDLAGGLTGGKRDLFEGGIRSPLLVRWDSQIEQARRGTTDQTATDLTDFIATVAEISDASTPVGVDGISLLPVITGEGERRAGKVILSENFENSQTGNQTADWTLIRNDEKLIKFRDGSYGLYNLATDPTESNPLDLAVQQNLSLKNELEQIAFAEGAGQADNYYVRYAAWTGSGNSSFRDQNNWSVGVPVAQTWSAVVNNTTGTPQTINVNESTSVLGLEVKGENGDSTIQVSPGQILTARNEIRIGNGGRLEIASAELSTARWISVSGNGTIAGEGKVTGVVYNEGLIAPGREAGLPPIDNTPEPLGELVPRELDSGLVTLVDFDFSGIQDDAPLEQVSSLQTNTNIAEGFNFGPATSARNAANAGDEFNVMGFSVSNTLSSALTGNNYLTFTLEADAGAGLLIDEIRIDLWRNGANAADQYAIFTSIDGFEASDVLAQLSFAESVSGIASTQSIVASPLLSGPVAGPIEVRLYGWGSNNSAGNTHFNHVSATGTVIAIPTWELDFTGTQDLAGLTTTTESSSTELQLVDALDIASGLSFSNTNDSGDEYNISGWTTSATLSQAQASEDYLSFSVQPIEGLAVAFESVAFNVWRDGSDAPSDFAVMSSLGGFGTSDLPAGELTLLTTGEASRGEVVGLFDGMTTTQEVVEFRLYGWNAGSLAGNLHVDGVSLRALFQTVFDVDLDPTGLLSIDGDLHHRQEGLIDLELGVQELSDPQNLSHDQLAISGDVFLEGNLRLSLVDGLLPNRGDFFELITASSVQGEFEEVEVVATSLDSTLTLKLVYESDRVLAVVAPAIDGDYNADGIVDAADYTVWRDSFGIVVSPYANGDGDGNGIVNQLDYQVWITNYGLTAPSLPILSTVPEPSSSVMLMIFMAKSAIGIRK